MQILKVHFFPGPLFKDASADIKQRFKFCCAALSPKKMAFSFIDNFGMPSPVVQHVIAVEQSEDQVVFFRFGCQSKRDDLLHIDAKAFRTEAQPARDLDPETTMDRSQTWGRAFLSDMREKQYNLDEEAHASVSVPVGLHQLLLCRSHSFH